MSVRYALGVLCLAAMAASAQTKSLKSTPHIKASPAVDGFREDVDSMLSMPPVLQDEGLAVLLARLSTASADSSRRS
jgi:hypothetical protein